ncbi:type VII secretion integral membrane protein EccD [Streptomyces yokosukanensis]|uniref:Type VII secretion integral membrane protein EccD n=1 Tax=Streptomyces yokosukanensis TaxID=67386 RepID=A0A101NWX9_9ACTN|nr:type VII secretion integral membrane protein EccD [Streptomyces yokosukanensis]
MSRDTVSRTALSRVTLVGEQRRVDLVLPSQEPVGLLLPEVMRLLGDRVGHRPEDRHLVTADGTALEPEATLESAGVPDGAVLRLVRVEDAPSAPAVHDVSDEAAGDLDVRAWRWNARTRRIVAAGAGVVWALAAGFVAREGFGAKTAGSALLASAAVATVAGALLGRAGRKGLAAALVVLSAAVGVQGAWSVADAQAWAGPVRLAVVLAVVIVALSLLGSFSPFGRGALVGAGALAGAGVCWEVAFAVQSGGTSTVGSARAGALLAVVSVVALGVLPRLALAAAGLSALDDRRSAGSTVSRYEVTAALAATHRGLVLATVVTAISGAVAAVLTVRTVTVWTVLVAVAVTCVLALRARAYPLVGEVVALLAASMTVALRLAWLWLERSGAAAPLAVLGTLVILSLGVLAVQPAEHARIRLRRAGDVLESVGVIALLPLVLGVFGVYARLLGTFA